MLVARFAPGNCDVTGDVKSVNGIGVTVSPESIIKSPRWRKRTVRLYR
jgi:hypothetical protein